MKNPPLDRLVLNEFHLCQDQVRRLEATGCKLQDYAREADLVDKPYVPNGWQMWKILFPAGSVMLKCPRDYDPKKRNNTQARGEIGIRGKNTDWLFAWKESDTHTGSPRRFLRLVKADLL
jgi:hypothetical protein